MLDRISKICAIGMASIALMDGNVIKSLALMIVIVILTPDW